MSKIKGHSISMPVLILTLVLNVLILPAFSTMPNPREQATVVRKGVVPSNKVWSTGAMALLHPLVVAGTLAVAVTTVDPSGKSLEITGAAFLVTRPNVYNYENPEHHDVKNRGKDHWYRWIVTCAHNVHEATQDRPVRVEFNLLDRTKRKIVQKFPADRWVKHPKWRPDDKTTYQYDVAVALGAIPPDLLSEVDFTILPPHMQLSRASIKQHGIVEGDEVYTVGFPLGRGYGEINNPLVRHGIIAQISPYTRGESDTVLVDGAIWPGNSGGPVMTKPTTISLEGTQAYNRNSLLGMVSATGISPESPGKIPAGIPAGIGIVVPTETINQTIDIAIRSFFPS